MKEIRDFLSEGPLLFDGAFGTYYSQKYKADITDCEAENIKHPDQVKEVHRAYLRAGADAIKTNTFNAYDTDENREALLVNRAVCLAREAVEEEGENAYVFADLGPAPGDTDEIKEANYLRLVNLFLKEDVDCFLFETLSENAGLLNAISRIREEKPQAFVVVSYAVMPDGYSREGRYYRNLMKEMFESGLCDVVGFNCVSSPKHMGLLIERLHTRHIGRICMMPNAGYPVVRGFRSFFDGSAAYYAKQIGGMAQKGVRILGGCCGTTPEHIEKMKAELAKVNYETLSFDRRLYENGQLVWEEEEKQNRNAHLNNRLRAKMEAGQKVIAVELDSPKNADVTKFMESALRLQKAGIDTMTIADCPIAVARMDSTLLACKMKRELDLDVIPHLTCRDRNTNATKALLLGAHAEGIRNVLLITGDPIPSAQRDEVKQVYQFNSRKLMGYVSSLNEEMFAEEPLSIFGALNVNAVNFEVELKRAQQKIQEGCVGFLTQPAMTTEAIANLRKTRESLGNQAFILGGIIPVISERNGRFMNEEINGIRIPEEMIAAYAGADRKQGEALGQTFTLEIAQKIAPYVDGFYLMTPFNRIDLMEKIVKDIKREFLS